MWVDKKLNAREVVLMFAVLSLAYVYPIIHADYAYVDDNWRSLLLAQHAWRDQGRILIEWLHEALTFGSGTTNIFPLPLLLSIGFLVMAMSRLTWWYFQEPTVSSTLIVFPLLGSPFFLGNLTYQYDGPAMVLAVVTVIYAITCRLANPRVRGVVVVVLLTATLSLYQVAIALFVGLCVVEFYVGVKEKLAVVEILSVAAQRVGQLLGAGMLYFLTTYQMVVEHRGDLYPLNGHWFEEVCRKFVFSMDKISVLALSGAQWLCTGVLIVSLAGFVFFIKNIPGLKGGRQGKFVVALMYMLGLPVLVLAVPGVMLFLVEPNLEARNYMAFSALLVFLFMLSSEMLARIQPNLRLLLAVPVLYMFTLSYAYGQVIIAKKELESALAQYLAYDLVSHAELRQVNRFYYVGPTEGGNWLPRGYAALTYMPLLTYILSESNVALHAEFLTRQGIVNVLSGSREVFNAAVAAGTEKAVVDSKFYSIYLHDDDAFIVMKDLVGPQNYTAN